MLDIAHPTLQVMVPAAPEQAVAGTRSFVSAAAPTHERANRRLQSHPFGLSIKDARNSRSLPKSKSDAGSRSPRIAHDVAALKVVRNPEKQKLSELFSSVLAHFDATSRRRLEASLEEGVTPNGACLDVGLGLHDLHLLCRRIASAIVRGAKRARERSIVHENSPVERAEGARLRASISNSLPEAVGSISTPNYAALRWVAIKFL